MYTIDETGFTLLLIATCLLGAINMLPNVPEETKKDDSND